MVLGLEIIGFLTEILFFIGNWFPEEILFCHEIVYVIIGFLKELLFVNETEYEIIGFL